MQSLFPLFFLMSSTALSANAETPPLFCESYFKNVAGGSGGKAVVIGGTNITGLSKSLKEKGAKKIALVDFNPTGETQDIIIFDHHSEKGTGKTATSEAIHYAQTNHIGAFDHVIVNGFDTDSILAFSVATGRISPKYWKLAETASREGDYLNTENPQAREVENIINGMVFGGNSFKKNPWQLAEEEKPKLVEEIGNQINAIMAFVKDRETNPSVRNPGYESLLEVAKKRDLDGSEKFNLWKENTKGNKPGGNVSQRGNVVVIKYPNGESNLPTRVAYRLMNEGYQAEKKSGQAVEPLMVVHANVDKNGNLIYNPVGINPAYYGKSANVINKLNQLERDIWFEKLENANQNRPSIDRLTKNLSTFRNQILEKEAKSNSPKNTVSQVLELLTPKGEYGSPVWKESMKAIVFEVFGKTEADRGRAGWGGSPDRAFGSSLQFGSEIPIEKLTEVLNDNISS